ncbi:MAG: hypothetical protein ACNYPE_04380, partial [Candidatus Azotimanducaceae bacterium WSBS_2022_MAG_OTU7]
MGLLKRCYGVVKALIKVLIDPVLAVLKARTFCFSKVSEAINLCVGSCGISSRRRVNLDN